MTPLDERPTLDDLVNDIDFGPPVKPSPPLPVVVPEFTMGSRGQWTFRDGREIPKNDLVLCFVMLEREIRAKYPVEIRCNQVGLIQADLVDYTKKYGEEKARDFLTSMASQRAPASRCEGDIHPVMLGIYDTATDELIGSFQWAGITLIGQPERLDGKIVSRYSALPISAFVWMKTMEEKHALTLDLIEVFLAHPGMVLGDEVFMFREAHAPLYRDAMRGDAWDKTIETWEVALEERRTRAIKPLRVDETEDPEKPKRKYQIVRRGV